MRRWPWSLPDRPPSEQQALHDADVREALEAAEAIGIARHLARLDEVVRQLDILDAGLARVEHAVKVHDDRLDGLAKRVTVVENFGVRRGQ